MKLFFKTLLVVASALAASCLLLSISSTLGLYSTFIYLFFILLFYGWWIYFPFVGIHHALFSYFKLRTWWTAVVIGSTLAIGIVVALKFSPIVIITMFPRFSDSKTLDIVSFGVGGGVYGLLYYFWLAEQFRMKSPQRTT